MRILFENCFWDTYIMKLFALIDFKTENFQKRQIFHLVFCCAVFNYTTKNFAKISYRFQKFNVK